MYKGTVVAPPAEGDTHALFEADDKTENYR